jgi:hypothetical protein
MGQACTMYHFLHGKLHVNWPGFETWQHGKVLLHVSECSFINRCTGSWQCAGIGFPFCIMTVLPAGHPRNRLSIPDMCKIFIIIEICQDYSGAHAASFSVCHLESVPRVKRPMPEAENYPLLRLRMSTAVPAFRHATHGLDNDKFEICAVLCY